MMPASTSPVPAVASRASPAATTRTSPAGSATTVAGPLSSTTAPRVGGQPAGGGDAVGARALPGEQPELAVVGRQHGRRRAAAQQRGGAVVVPGQGEQPVAVDDDRHAAPPATVARTAATVSSSRPRPGPIDERVEAVRGRRARRPTSRTPAAACARPRAAPSASTPGRRQRRPCPLPARCAAPAARWAAPGHARAAGDDPHGPRPLVRRRRPGPPPARRRRRPRRGRPWPDVVSRPMSATSTSPASIAARRRTAGPASGRRT